MTQPTPPAPVASVAADSARAGIRTAIAAQLAAVVGTTGGGAPVYRTAAGPRVYPARNRILHAGVLPAILVYARDEPIPPQPDGHGNGFTDSWKTRDLALHVEIVAAYDDRVDDVLDGIAAQVEAALDDVTITGRESATILLESTEIGANLKADIPIGAALQTWRIRHRTPWRVAADDGVPVTTVTWRQVWPDGSTESGTLVPEAT